MPNDRHGRTKAIFLAALDHGQPDRDAFIPRVCGDEEALVPSVALPSPKTPHR